MASKILVECLLLFAVVAIETSGGFSLNWVSQLEPGSAGADRVSIN